jgi:hypothetical protein
MTRRDPDLCIRSIAPAIVLVTSALGSAAAPLEGACPRSTLVFADDFESNNQVAWLQPWLGGYSRDFWTGGALSGTTLALSAPARADTSRGDGRYRFLDLAAATAPHADATRPSGYRATRNGPIALGGARKGCDLFSMASADVQRQYTIAGLVETAGNSFVAGWLEGPDGSPLEGIPMADLTLTNGGSPVGIGPYFFGLVGDIDPGITVSAAFAGRVGFAFLNVPAGTLTLSVASVEPSEEDTETLSVAASGAHFVVLGGSD